MAELRERDNKKKTYALEPTTNGGTEPLQKKVPLDGDGVSVEGGKGVKLKRQVTNMILHFCHFTKTNLG